MIHISESATVEAHGKRTNEDLYRILRGHIGSTILVRHEKIERVGKLNRVSFKRDQKDLRPSDAPISYSFDSEDRIGLSILQQVELFDGEGWKVLHYGHFKGNREL